MFERREPISIVYWHLHRCRGRGSGQDLVQGHW